MVLKQHSAIVAPHKQLYSPSFYAHPASVCTEHHHASAACSASPSFPHHNLPVSSTEPSAILHHVWECQEEECQEEECQEEECQEEE